MSRRPIHPNLKELAGTTRKDRLRPEGVTLPVVDELPEPPDWLPNAHAVTEWNRLAAMLKANGLLTELGLPALGHLCGIHGKLVQLWAAGETPHAALLAQYRGLVSDFGLTPMAQLKLPAPTPKPGNKFANNGTGKRPSS